MKNKYTNVKLYTDNGIRVNAFPYSMSLEKKREEKIPPPLLTTRDASCSSLFASRRMKESSHVFERNIHPRTGKAMVCTYRKIGTHKSLYVF